MNVLRPLVDGITLLLGRLKKKQRISLTRINQQVKINIGCGLAIAPGWVNVDGSFNALVATWPRFLHRLFYYFSGSRRYYSREAYCHFLKENTFVFHDLSHGLPFADCMVDFAYSSHFIEHLFRKDAVWLFKEIHRVLKPGGVVRISVPDLEYAIALYQSGEKEKMLSSYFFIEDDNSYFARHKFMYDFEMLAKVLENEGFKDIHRCSFQEGHVPDLTVLDNRPEESLFIEATKGEK